MQPKPREVVIDTVMGYLESDGMLCREEPGPLSLAQSQVCRQTLLVVASLSDAFSAASAPRLVLLDRSLSLTAAA